MANEYFRASVVAVITNSDGQVLALERRDIRGQWQLPQGGVDRGEPIAEAVWREMEEETGLTSDDVELVEQFPEWTVYEWPIALQGQGCLGQCQRWFTFRVRDDAVVPVPDGHEFVDWAWVTPAWLIDHVVEFRRASYRQVLADG